MGASAGQGARRRAGDGMPEGAYSTDRHLRRRRSFCLRDQALPDAKNNSITTAVCPACSPGTPRRSRRRRCSHRRAIGSKNLRRHWHEPGIGSGSSGPAASRSSATLETQPPELSLHAGSVLVIGGLAGFEIAFLLRAK
jgi:hypothetical protein